ncbi:MAG: TRAP transporter large permease subunit [Marinobacter sp.]|nr:TRAP transporter large permease subunit [Marinobacter sp.]
MLETNEKETRAASAAASASLSPAPGQSAKLADLAGYLAGGALLAAALIVTTDILLRWGISQPIKGLFEIMELVFACIIALSFAFANKKRMHVSMELVGNVTGRFRGVQLYADALTALTFAIYTYFLFHHAVQKMLYGETTLVLGVPIGPIWYLAAGLITLGLLTQLSALRESAVSLGRSPSVWLSELAAPAISLAAALAAALFLIWTAADQGAVVKVLLGFAILYFLALAHVPIGVSMGLTGLVGCYAVLDIGAAQLVGANNLSSTISSTDLAAIPLFLLMGNLAIASGFADDIFEAATAIFGRMRGGHALATVLGCAGFGAISGSSVATTATLGGVAFREMRARSYADSLATGSIAAGGTLGALIPPSVILIIYCVIAELSISEAFTAALIPGILALFLYTIAVMILVRLRPSLAPPPDKSLRFAPLVALKLAWRPILLFMSVLGGLYGGIFTVQEAAAVGTGFAFVFWLLSGQASVGGLKKAISEAAGTAAGLYLLIVGANIFGAYLNLAGVTTAILSIIDPAVMPAWLVLTILVIMYLVLGSVFDTVAALVVTVPFVIPIILAMDLDLIWWGIVTLALVEIGMITPPIGMNVFVMKSLVRDEVSITTIFRGVVPFLAADMVRLVLLITIPALTLWLPRLLQ